MTALTRLPRLVVRFSNPAAVGVPLLDMDLENLATRYMASLGTWSPADSAPLRFELHAPGLAAPILFDETP